MICSLLLTCTEWTGPHDLKKQGRLNVSETFYNTFINMKRYQYQPDCLQRLKNAAVTKIYIKATIFGLLVRINS